MGNKQGQPIPRHGGADGFARFDDEVAAEKVPEQPRPQLASAPRVFQRSLSGHDAKNRASDRLPVFCKCEPPKDGAAESQMLVTGIDSETGKPHSVRLRMGRRKVQCGSCRSDAVDVDGGICFVCGGPQPMLSFYDCPDCKQQAPPVKALLRMEDVDEDFECDVMSSDHCSESQLVMRFRDCPDDHVACAECYFEFVCQKLDPKDLSLRWDAKLQRACIGCLYENAGCKVRSQ